MNNDALTVLYAQVDTRPTADGAFVGGKRQKMIQLAVICTIIDTVNGFPHSKA